MKKWVTCEKCGHRWQVDVKESRKTSRGLGGFGGALIGAALGGPLGLIAGAASGGIFGDMITNLHKCPKCGESYWI